MDGRIKLKTEIRFRKSIRIKIQSKSETLKSAKIFLKDYIVCDNNEMLPSLQRHLRLEQTNFVSGLV